MQVYIVYWGLTGGSACSGLLVRVRIKLLNQSPIYTQHLNSDFQMQMFYIQNLPEKGCRGTCLTAKFPSNSTPSPSLLLFSPSLSVFLISVHFDAMSSGSVMNGLASKGTIGSLPSAEWQHAIWNIHTTPQTTWRQGGGN